MPARVEKIPNDPIIVITYEGFMDVEIVLNAFRRSLEVAQEHDLGKPVYRISDVRQGEGTFVDVINIVSEIAKGQPGSTSDPDVVGVFVGTHEMARLYAEFLKQKHYGGTHIPFFASMDDAADYLRLQISQHRGHL